MDYFAHSANDNGKEQLLLVHNKGVARLMKDFAFSPEYEKIFEYCGAIHDFGKYQDSFQKYLKEGGIRGSAPHAIWGGYMAKQHKDFASAFAISGHHRGLFDLGTLSARFKEDCVPQENIYSQIKTAFQTDLHKYDQTVEESNLTAFNQIDQTTNQRELFIRMLFSALVDADWLDTERHFTIERNNMRQSPIFDIDKLLDLLHERFKRFRQNTPLNRLRTSVREYAVSRANSPIGFYSLTLPTGMGKTLCSVDWALHHAQFNHLKRIIIVLPYISIIDQTANELKDIFGEEYVLEHHSDFTFDVGDEAFNKKMLATENWDYPIIVTTSVQFFESLFSNKPSRCRKLHNISNSVVIFDEVQTIPTRFLQPTLSVMQDLRDLCQTSMLFCTATQPAFESRVGFRGLSDINPLVAEPQKIFTLTQRVKYVPVNSYNQIELKDLSDEVLKSKGSALVVLNTKKKAADLYQLIKKQSECGVFHLSTSMCPAHRKAVIGNIKLLLAKEEKIILISTQLIEAGVDMDFETVFREVAPLESIIQSGGRCNREGKRICGIVHIFALSDNRAPNHTYSQLGEYAKSKYENNEDKLGTYDFYTDYYRQITRLFCNTDEENINDSRRKFEFETIADEYKFIDNRTTPIFIYQYNEESKALYNSVKDSDFLRKDELRRMSQYSVQVYDNIIKTEAAHIGIEKSGFYIWTGRYDAAVGLQPGVELDNLIL